MTSRSSPRRPRAPGKDATTQSRVSAALDRKERVIYVDDGVDLDGKRRFKRLHEVTHDILPWQQDTAYADSNLTLSWSTKAGFEQEANQGGAELLFQRRRFEEMASDYTIGFGAVFELADLFGASYHAAFRRYVETHRHQLAGVVLQRSPCEPGGGAYRRKEATNSESWGQHYDAACDWPSVLRTIPYGFVEKISLLVDDPLPLTFGYPNLNHEHETLHAELWSNSYNVFALIWAPRRERLKRRRVVRSAVAER